MKIKTSTLNHTSTTEHYEHQNHFWNYNICPLAPIIPVKKPKLHQ